MPTLEEIVSDLRGLFKLEYETHQSASGLAPSMQIPTYQEVIDIQKESGHRIEVLIKKRLKQFLLFPPQHSRHQSKLEAFYTVAKYDESVFIMTKFPEGDSQQDSELTRVINAVSKSTIGCGYHPRLASSEYHPLLWDNVELHLLGCCRGVAILEDRYKPELNPNVAMEWGWMRGMGKEVLFLVENNFKNYRADLSGLVEHRFSWENPEEGVERAVKSWLKDRARQSGE